MTDIEKPTLLLVDGHSLAYRAFYALPVENFATKDGQHTNGIYGFLSMFVNLLKAENPTHVAVAFDTARESFRTREYPEYKANRSESPSEFKGQIPLLQETLEAMGITVIAKPDFEADDIMATLSTQGADAGWSVLVCSGDRDTIQLVTDDVTLLYPSVQGVSKLKRYDPPAVFEKYGVEPAMYPDIAALVGETSDNLPGVPKVGEKTAVKWLNQFGSLDAVIEGAETIKGVVGGNLRDHIEDVRRNRRLNRLLRDVELPVAVAELERKPLDSQAVRDIFAKLEFRALLPRVFEAAGSAEGDDDGAAPVAEAPQPKQLEAADIAAWAGAATGEVGLALTLADGLPDRIGLATADEVVEASWSAGVAESLGEWLASDAPKVVADAKPQVKALTRAGAPLRGLAYDPILAGWLVRPSFPDKTLAHLVERLLGETLPEADPSQLVPEHDGATPGQLAWYTVRVADPLRDEMPDSVTPVFTDIEMPTILALADVELAGVAVSHEKLSAFAGELGGRTESLAQEAFATIGHEVNLGSPKQLQEVLFTELDLPKTRKTKTGYTTDAAALADLQEEGRPPVPRAAAAASRGDQAEADHRRARQSNRRDEAHPHDLRADRKSDGAPLQHRSEPAEHSGAHRGIPRASAAAFEVGSGYETLLTADYSQIEMRIMAHLSGDQGLIEAFKSGEDLHRYVGSHVFGVEPGDVTSQMRSKVKAMSYGLVYGLSAFGLAKQLRIEQREAKQLMVDYFSRFGAVRDYLRGAVRAGA